MTLQQNSQTKQTLAIYKIILSSLLLLTPLVTQAQQDGMAWIEQTRNLHPERIKTNDHAPATITAIRELTAHWQGCAVILERDKNLDDNEGFSIEKDSLRNVLHIKARNSCGLLYGAYELLRTQATKTNEEIINISQKPLFAVRITPLYAVTKAQTNYNNHRKNEINLNEIDGKRGTMSIRTREKLTQYCRALVSIGINGIVLQVSDGSANVMSQTYINKVKAIANVCRSYAIKLYLTADLTSPRTSLSLSTINANGESPKKWWKDKMKNLYRDIHDIGGFVVELPKTTFGNTKLAQAEIDMKASILAEAITPYKGIVMISHSISAPKSLIFDDANNDNEIKNNITSQYKNIVDLLKNESTTPPSAATLIRALTSTNYNDVIIQIPSTLELENDSTAIISHNQYFKDLLNITSTSKITGVMFEEEADDDEASANGILLSKSTYYFARLIWGANEPSCLLEE